jgi:hypothetical protein
VSAMCQIKEIVPQGLPWLRVGDNPLPSTPSTRNVSLGSPFKGPLSSGNLIITHSFLKVLYRNIDLSRTRTWKGRGRLVL